MLYVGQETLEGRFCLADLDDQLGPAVSEAVENGIVHELSLCRSITIT
jgi:hypothetical protein